MTECVCEGNWRRIIAETEPFLDRAFKDKSGNKFYLQGILWASDDFYYIMYSPDHGTEYCSCCCSIDYYGFVLS